MFAYYNEIDPFCIQWLKNLIAKGLIAPGDVDGRDIRDVKADDLRSYTQCHFFAGIGGWSYALRLAGWSDDREVWTGSCPCQPFSAAGKRVGVDDERHLWPSWYWLINERRPTIIFGEQVASKAALAWLDLVQADLETSLYAVEYADLCAAGVGAAHIRQRLYFVAHRPRDGRREERADVRRYIEGDRAQGQPAGSMPRAAVSWLAERVDNSTSPRRIGEIENSEGKARDEARLRVLSTGGGSRRVADRLRPRLEIEREQQARGELATLERSGETREVGRASAIHGPWADADWLKCRDGKWRPVEPGTFPLAHGVPGRVGRLRAYGNAIVPQVAAAFINAAMECIP